MQVAGWRYYFVIIWLLSFVIIRPLSFVIVRLDRTIQVTRMMQEFWIPWLIVSSDLIRGPENDKFGLGVGWPNSFIIIWLLSFVIVRRDRTIQTP